MTAATLTQETYLPEAGEGVAEVYDFMKAHEATGRGRPEPRYLLIGSGPGEQVELPVGIYRVLRQVVEAMQHNVAVTVSPQTRTLTTQQAADLLGVSRPTVIKLLDEQKIPYERTASHRRILLQDLLAYREHRRAAQYAALASTSVALDGEGNVDTVLRELQDARHEVTRRRKALPGP